MSAESSVKFRVNEQGFSILESVFSHAECDDILKSIYDSGLPIGKGGTRNLMSVATIGEVANDPRMLSIAAAFLGNDLIPYKATLFEKTGRSNWLVAWHQDTALPVVRNVDLDGWGPMSVKDGVTFVHAPTEALSRIVAIRVHLDPSTADNGPLRVVAGTHGKRFTDDLDFDATVARGEQFECLVGKGGAIAMSPLLIHASSKAKSEEPRRVLHIEYADSMEIAPEIQLAIA